MMKITAIILLVCGVSSLVLYPPFLFAGILGAPFVALGFAGVFYCLHKINLLEKK